MQRNVLYSQPARFALAFTMVLILSACGMTEEPWTNDLNTVTAPTVSTPAPLPAAPAPQAMPAQPTRTVTGNKVAILLPMTGRGSDAGQAMLNAAQLAMFDLGADVFELIPADTGASAGGAASDAIQKGAKLILGPLFAADAKSVSPIALQSGINVISFSTDASAASANTFILGFLPQSQVNRVIEYAGGKGLTRIALIAPNDAYGNAVAATFETGLRQRSLMNAGILRYDGAQPSQEQVTEFLNSHSSSAVLIAANISQSAVISQMIPAGIQRLGTGLWDQADGAKYPSLNGAWYAASSPKLRQKFESQYRATYGDTPPRLASLAYDAAALAVVLSKQGQGFNRDALANPNGFAGIDGIFRFMPDGLNERGLAVLQIGPGQASVIQDAPQSFR